LASYLIRVETGSQSGAGTDATISISLIGKMILIYLTIVTCLKK